MVSMDYLCLLRLMLEGEADELTSDIYIASCLIGHPTHLSPLIQKIQKVSPVKQPLPQQPMAVAVETAYSNQVHPEVHLYLKCNIQIAITWSPLNHIHLLSHRVLERINRG